MTTPENQDSLERLTRTNKELVNAASIGVVDLVYDLTESIFLKIPEDFEDRKTLEEAIEILSAFVGCNFPSILARPRQERTKDRVRFLPGQHKGIFISYVTESHDFGNFNIYGGLRDIHSPFELKDTDLSMRRHHTKRTDTVLSQTVQFNFHVKSLENASLIDVWYTYSLNKAFRLDKLIVDGQTIDISVAVDEGDFCFKELKDRFNAHTRILTSLVPSV